MIDLSRETIAVRGYLQDARVILQEQVGDKVKPEVGAALIVEVARMIQHEHNRSGKKKPSAGSSSSTAKKPSLEDPVTVARRNPKTPPMVPDIEAPAEPKRSRKKPEPERKASKRTRRR